MIPADFLRNAQLPKKFENEEERVCKVCKSEYCEPCYEALDKCGQMECETWCCWSDMYEMPCGEILCGNDCHLYHNKYCRCERGTYGEQTKCLGPREQGKPVPKKASGTITFGAGGDADFV